MQPAKIVDVNVFSKEKLWIFFVLNSFKKAFRVWVTYLNIHTWKKNVKNFCVCKYDAQMSDFAVVKKALGQWKKFFFLKKKSVIFETVCGYLTFGDFTRPRNCKQKLVIKIERQKIKKIPPIISENIITQIISQNFCKTGLNPNVLWRFPTRVEVSIR